MKQNKYSAFKNIHDKQAAFIKGMMSDAIAYCSDGTALPLYKFNISQVEFIAGRWRVQDAFPHKIQVVRDRELVLADKLSHTERMPFQYWRAYTVGENCYGKFISVTPDVIVARYATDNGVYWSYGRTIEQARAFLGIKLFDEYMDLIHKKACKSMQKQRTK